MRTEPEDTDPQAQRQVGGRTSFHKANVQTSRRLCFLLSDKTKHISFLKSHILITNIPIIYYKTNQYNRK